MTRCLFYTENLSPSGNIFHNTTLQLHKEVNVPHWIRVEFDLMRGAVRFGGRFVTMIVVAVVVAAAARSNVVDGVYRSTNKLLFLRTMHKNQGNRDCL